MSSKEGGNAASNPSGSGRAKQRDASGANMDNSTLASLLLNFQKAQKEKKDVLDKCARALRRGEEADDTDYVARLKCAKKKYMESATVDNKE